MNKERVLQIADINFETSPSIYKGKNGYGKMCGIGLQAEMYLDTPVVTLNPINSSGAVSDAAILRIPEAEVPKVIEKLLQVTGLPVLTRDQINTIEDQVLKTWEKRRETQGYTKTKKVDRQYQCEFLMGVFAALDVITNAAETKETSMSPKVFFSILRGEYVE